MELAVLRALRLKGRASADDVAAATGKSSDAVSAELARLVEAQEAREVNGNYMLLPAGRDRLNELLAKERASVDAGAVHELYEQFTPINDDFKQMANAWQMRGEELNDHSDAAYDQSVLDRLPGIHERVTPIVERLAAIAPRLAVYNARLALALERTQGGDHQWLLKPLIDSYHTVWFELHEEMIGLAGLSREAEAAGGRAE